METITNVEVEIPQWVGKQPRDREFCEEFSSWYPMVHVGGSFFGPEGMVSDETVKMRIYQYISAYYSTGLSKKVNAMLEALKLALHMDAFQESETRIHCANGTLNLMDNTLSPQKAPCRFRLPVNYNPNAPKPELWLKFLGDLLEPEDILTLQEFFGYCLLPMNYAQKMLIIIGQGGEGKSRVGIIARHLLGDAMVNGSLAKLEVSPFARADLQNRLLMVDDDLQLSALKTTGYIKSIITAEQPLDLERKGVQSYQGMLYCRLMAFGNGTLRSLHDRSHGFFRRQILLSAKPRPADREDEPFLARMMCDELEGILLWALEGLYRLVENNMRFTMSRSAIENLSAAISDGDNTVEFMQSEGYFRRDPEGEITSRRLYRLYQDWCEDNALTPLCAKSFTAALTEKADQYGITYTRCIHSGEGRYVRGFRGIRSCGRA